MSFKLSEPPLVLAIIHLKAEGFAGLGSAIESIRSAVSNLGYTGFENAEIKSQLVRLNADDGGVSVTHQSQRRYVFNGDRKYTQIQLSDGDLVFKCSDYQGRDSFIKSFMDVYEACYSECPAVCESLAEQISIRYSNLIATPKGQVESPDLISPDLMPNSQISKLGRRHYSSGMSIFVPDDNNSVLKVRTEEIRPESKRIQKFLPDDLLEGDNRLAMNIRPKSWWPDIESEAYYILDIDHGKRFPESPKYSSVNVKDELLKLQLCCHQAFEQSVTVEALDAWGRQSRDS